MGRIITALILVPSLCFGWSKDGTTYTTDGSRSDVGSAFTDASNGDRIEIPSGTFTWTNTLSVSGKAVTFAGNGYANTVLEGSVTLFQINESAGDGWRITGIALNNTGGYHVYTTGGTYGLVDNCSFLGYAGNDEMMFLRGPNDSWQTASSLGTTNAIYVEDCVFSGDGYVCDVNNNGRAVFRFNTINGQNKIDGHGYASNSERGVRHMEIYSNHWTAAASFWKTMDLRGGTGMVFDNLIDNRGGVSVNYPSFYITDYGVANVWPNFFNTYQTPDNYPIADQIGTGQDTSIVATAISAGLLVEIESVGTTDFTAIGSADNDVGTRFIATGAGTGTGTVTYSPAATEPMYVWNNIQNGTRAALSVTTIPSGATNEYGGDFALFQDIIVPNRDFFIDIAQADIEDPQAPALTFDGSEGIGRGTAAQMAAITPTTTGVGFWVTDEGEWWADNAGTDGRLYVWDGDSWELEYTPLVYPHPLRAGEGGGGGDTWSPSQGPNYTNFWMGVLPP